MNPCAVKGCTCSVARFGPRATRVRLCKCCVARLQPAERKLFAKATQKESVVVRAILALLAGELAMDIEDALAAAAASARETAATSPFLADLDEATRELLKSRLRGEAAS